MSDRNILTPADRQRIRAAVFRRWIEEDEAKKSGRTLPRASSGPPSTAEDEMDPRNPNVGATMNGGRSR